jgi:hypothetical protein
MTDLTDKAKKEAQEQIMDLAERILLLYGKNEVRLLLGRLTVTIEKAGMIFYT